MKRRVAVVGVGDFGALHARTLASLPEVELLALVDGDLPRARALAGELGVSQVFPTLGELITCSVADSVVIATRADTHPVGRARPLSDAPVDVLREHHGSAGVVVPSNPSATRADTPRAKLEPTPSASSPAVSRACSGTHERYARAPR